MPFVPTNKQRESLNNLVKQFINENTEIRLIRFMNLGHKNIKNNVIEILCLEPDDKYYVYYDGIIDSKLR